MSNTYLRSESSTLFSSGEGVRSSGWCASSLAPLFEPFTLATQKGKKPRRVWGRAVKIIDDNVKDFIHLSRFEHKVEYCIWTAV